MASRDMIDWQYRTLLGELQQVQFHAADSTCPCVLGDEGEYCLPKHCLAVSTIAAETAAMDSPNAGLLYELQESATEMHLTLKNHVCGEGEDTDAVAWSREWRKKVESIYYACAMQQPLTCQHNGDNKEDTMSTHNHSTMICDLKTDDLKQANLEKKRTLKNYLEIRLRSLKSHEERFSMWADRSKEEMVGRIDEVENTLMVIEHSPTISRMKQTDPLLTEIGSQVCGAGLCNPLHPADEHKLYEHCTGTHNPQWLECQKALDKVIAEVHKVPVTNPDSKLPVCSPPNRKKLERCIRKVKRSNRKVNPFAVCTASVGCKLRQGTTIEQPPELEVCHAS